MTDELPELKVTPPEPLSILFLNDGEEGFVFRRDKLSNRLYIRRGGDEELWDNFGPEVERQPEGFLVWDGHKHYKPDNWDDLTEQQQQDWIDNSDYSHMFGEYEEVYVGTWRRATAADLIQMKLING